MEVRDVRPHESAKLGELMVRVYSAIPGFPSPEDQPRYYQKLSRMADLAEQADTRVLVAIDEAGEIAGGVVYFSDMAAYGSGGRATSLRNTSGIRLLGVDPDRRGAGVGRLLTEYCIRLARELQHDEVVLHSTASMKIARDLYQRMGFERSADLDFMQEDLQVFGFRLSL